MVASPPTTFRSKPEFTKNYSDYTRIEMKMPIVRHTGNTPELDPPIFTGDGGLYSDAYFKQLKDDCDDESKQVMVHYHYMHSRDPWKLAAR
eukprot:gene28035-31135_t